MNKVLIQVTTDNNNIYAVEAESLQLFDEAVQFSRENEVFLTKDGTRVRYAKLVSYKKAE